VAMIFQGLGKTLVYYP